MPMAPPSIRRIRRRRATGRGASRRAAARTTASSRGARFRASTSTRRSATSGTSSPAISASSFSLSFVGSFGTSMRPFSRRSSSCALRPEPFGGFRFEGAVPEVSSGWYGSPARRPRTRQGAQARPSRPTRPLSLPLGARAAPRPPRRTCPRRRGGGGRRGAGRDGREGGRHGRFVCIYGRTRSVSCWAVLCRSFVVGAAVRVTRVRPCPFFASTMSCEHFLLFVGPM